MLPGVTPTPYDELLDLLDLRPTGIEVAARHARRSVETQHVFGGLVAAQAFVAAARTVAPERAVHSLHAYFLRPGDPEAELLIRVEPTRDGRAFSHRRVAAVQHGKSIMEASVSFATPSVGLRHEEAAPVVPAPETLSPDHDVVVSGPGAMPGPVELRTVGMGSSTATSPVLTWMRTCGPLPADPVLRAALLLYATDLMVLEAVVRPHGRSMHDPDVHPLTIDHAVWFHRVPPDGWWLQEATSAWAGDGRGTTRGRVHSADGTLLAEVAQEGLVRVG
jgi:acyl-CoA thioesterase-2